MARLGPFYESRLRALRKLDGKTCPGQGRCTTDRTNGEIAGVHGRVQGRTLENYCHDKEATKENGLKHGCPLYNTKPENVPPSLIGAIEAAEELRELKELGLLPSINELTAWEVACFKAAEHASRKIEAEAIKEMNSNSSGNSSDRQTPLGEFGEQSADSVFKDW